MPKKETNPTTYSPKKRVDLKCTPLQYKHLRDFVKKCCIGLQQGVNKERGKLIKTYRHSSCAAAHQLLEKLNDKVAHLLEKKQTKLYNLSLTAVEASHLVELKGYFLQMNMSKIAKGKEKQSNQAFEDWEEYIQPIIKRIQDITGMGGSHLTTIIIK